MNIRKILIPAVVSLILIAACGAPRTGEIKLSGTITIPETLSGRATGPLFVGVSRTDDVELMQSDSVNQIITLVPADGRTFEITLTDSDAVEDDEIFIFALSDNDYSGGIPNPTPGDIIGFYLDKETLSTKYKLKAVNSPLSLNANRITYDISPEVIGLIDGAEQGDLVLIAYAGNFNSFDFTDLDTDAIIGYKKIHKGSEPCLYNLDILPYITPEKYSMPILGVYIIALLDRNSNGIPDAGDLIGFPTEGRDGSFPMAINIQNGVNSCSTIYFKKTISEPVTPDNPIRLTGTFDAPAGYDGTHMFLIVAKSVNPDEVFSNMIDTVKYFRNVSDSYSAAAGTFSFDEDLSSSGLLPGDTVMIIALWDKDFTAGFPAPTAGDVAGFVQNKSAFSFTVKLNSGVNRVVRGSDGSYSFNGNSGYDFSLKRTIYSHSASIKFKLEKGNLSDAEFANGNLVQVIALYDPSGTSLVNKQIDMDSIIASSSVLIQHDLNATVTSRYSMNVMPAIPSSITGINPSDFSIPDIYIAGFLDSNGNGRPDTGEKVAFYYKTILWLFDAPDKITIVDGINVPGKNIKFSQTF